ncbi:MAG: phasin family protein [Xanthomonadales bacterium]|nr:phasin family protein [Xanthomonadales bacterium]
MRERFPGMHAQCSVIALISPPRMILVNRTSTEGKEDIMARKKTKKKVQRKSTASKVVNPVVGSARDIWLAGLGAFSVAQEESGRIIEQGNKLFDRLVKEGSKVEKKTRKDVGDAVDEVREEVESRAREIRGDLETRFGGVRGQAESVRKQAGENWDRLENIFEERVTRVLSRMGIPTRDDVNSLSRRVQELSRRVAELDKETRATKTAVRTAARKATKAAAAKPAKKAATKKAAPKKAATKKAAPKKAATKKAAAKKAAVKKAGPKKAAPAKAVTGAVPTTGGQGTTPSA